MLEANYKELEQAKGSLSIDTYKKLSQQIASYSVEWELLNQQYKVACHRNAICLIRNKEMSKCADENIRYNETIMQMNKFIIDLKSVSLSAKNDSK